MPMPGRTITSTPMKPPSVASSRARVSRSPRMPQAKKATQIGMVNSSAKTEAKGNSTTPMVQKYWPVK